MKIKIMNRKEARRISFSDQEESTIIISITDIDMPDNTFNRTGWLKAVLKLKFDDEEQGHPNCITEEDTSQISAFIKEWKEKVNRIIVHCDAGRSRSAGVGAAIMKFLNDDDMPVFESNKFCPNMTCYRKTLNALMGFVDEEDLQNKEKINIEAWKNIKIACKTY